MAADDRSRSSRYDDVRQAALGGSVALSAVNMPSASCGRKCSRCQHRPFAIRAGASGPSSSGRSRARPIRVTDASRCSASRSRNGRSRSPSPPAHRTSCSIAPRIPPMDVRQLGSVRDDHVRGCIARRQFDGIRAAPYATSVRSAYVPTCCSPVVCLVPIAGPGPLSWSADVYDSSWDNHPRSTCTPLTQTPTFKIGAFDVGTRSFRRQRRIADPMIGGAARARHRGELRHAAPGAGLQAFAFTVPVLDANRVLYL